MVAPGPGVLAHVLLPENGDPARKVRRFAEAVDRLADRAPDIALMKLCHLDFEAGTDDAAALRALPGHARRARAAPPAHRLRPGDGPAHHGAGGREGCGEAAPREGARRPPRERSPRGVQRAASGRPSALGCSTSPGSRRPGPAGEARRGRVEGAPDPRALGRVHRGRRPPERARAGARRDGRSSRTSPRSRSADRSGSDGPPRGSGSPVSTPSSAARNRSESGIRPGDGGAFTLHSPVGAAVDSAPEGTWMMSLDSHRRGSHPVPPDAAVVGRGGRHPPLRRDLLRQRVPGGRAGAAARPRDPRAGPERDRQRRHPGHRAEARGGPGGRAGQPLRLESRARRPDRGAPDALDRAQSHANALHGYVAAMREDPESRGGIGLARIRFEAGLELALEVHGEKVTIHAAGPLAAPDPAALRRVAASRRSPELPAQRPGARVAAIARSIASPVQRNAKRPPGPARRLERRQRLGIAQLAEEQRRRPSRPAPLAAREERARVPAERRVLTQRGARRERGPVASEALGRARRARRRGRRGASRRAAGPRRRGRGVEARPGRGVVAALERGPTSRASAASRARGRARARGRGAAPRRSPRGGAARAGPCARAPRGARGRGRLRAAEAREPPAERRERAGRGARPRSGRGREAPRAPGGRGALRASSGGAALGVEASPPGVGVALRLRAASAASLRSG